MLSAVISSVYSYPAMRLASQPVHQGYVHSGPLVLGAAPVDMNSWEESACYPQSTFYPLSDGPSIQNHRITMTCFRTCSTCQSRSQATLCHCTMSTISDRT